MAKHSDYKMFIIIDRVTYLGVFVHILLAGLFYFLDYMNLAILNVACTVAWIHGKNLNAQGKQSLAIAFLSIEVILHTTAAVSTLGWESGFQFYLIGALIFNIFGGYVKLRETIGFIFVFMGVFIGLKLYTATQIYIHETFWLMDMMYYNNVLVAVIAISLVSFYFKEASYTSEENIKNIANTDVLTGLLTRRSLPECVESTLKPCLINKQNSVVIMADIDFFKNINDLHGHSRGDTVLKEVALRLKENLGHFDSVFRWGGDEFMIVLPNISMKDAQVISEGLREDIQAATYRFDNYELNVSMTFGLASYNEQNKVIDEVLNQADKALYEGKAKGRNCVVTYTSLNEYKAVAQEKRAFSSTMKLSGV